MTPFDYITDIALIAVVVLQMRVRTLTLRSLLLPLGLVAGAGIAYLRPISLAGNNLTLIAALVAAGITLGTLSGMTTSVWRQGDSVLSAPASSPPSSGYSGWEHASPSPSGLPTLGLPRSDASRSTTTSPVGIFGSSPWSSWPTARFCPASACSSSGGSVPSTPRAAGLPTGAAPTIHVSWSVRPHERS
jgi:hypothetical protein